MVEVLVKLNLFLKIMLSFLNIFKTQELLITERKFPNNFFLDKTHYNTIEKYGYLVLKNVVPQNQINFLSETYSQLTQFPEYSIQGKFQNSGRYSSPEIRSFVMKQIGHFSKEFLPLVFDISVFDENTTGAFQIKPPSKVSELNPHQDAPVIDETKENGLFVWVPLCDINEKNGAVLVLPGSHLWGNFQRSLNVPWVFEKYTKLLWKYMKPIYLNKGDILIWDTAMIHASLPNLSNEMRIALTTTLLPKQFKMVEYFKDAKTPKGKIEHYEVERSFWESEDIMKRPPCPPNYFIELQDEVYSSKLNKATILELIERFTPKN